MINDIRAKKFAAASAIEKAIETLQAETDAVDIEIEFKKLYTSKRWHRRLSTTVAIIKVIY